MATYYFDADNGSDGNDGLTPGTAKRWLEPFGAGASDRLLFRRGTRQLIQTTAEKTIVNGVPGAPTYYGVYGEAQVPYAIFTKPAGSPGSTILNGSHRRDYVVEDLFFDLAGTSAYNSLYVSATTSGNANGIRIRRCKFANSVGDRAGLYVGVENTINTVFDVLIDDCEFWNCGADGLTILAGSGVIARNCRGWDNGLTGVNGGHNFRMSSRFVSVSSGWTLVSGTVYSRALGSHETDVAFVRHGSYPRMVKNVATPTAPTVGQFGVSGGLLYINANGNPNGGSVNYVWRAGANNGFEYCHSLRSRWNTAAPFHEGHGMSFDDWASDSWMIGCVIEDSEGLGVSINGGDNNLIHACVIQRSEMRGISLGSGAGNQVTHCEFLRNNTGRDASNAEIGGSATAANTVIRNNIMHSPGRTYGVYFDSASGCVAENNLVFGTTDAVFGGTETGTVTIDPMYLDAMNALAGLREESPARRAGIFLAHGTLDRRGVPFQLPVDIGSVARPQPSRVAA